MNYEFGDQVQLVFGGPCMTVVRVEEKVIHVWWFDANGCLQRLEVERELLRPYQRNLWDSVDPFDDIKDPRKVRS